MPSIRLGMLNLPYKWNAKPQDAPHRLGLKSSQHFRLWMSYILNIVKTDSWSMFPFFYLSQKHQIEHWHTLTTCRALPNKGVRWRLAQNNYSPTHFHLQFFFSTGSPPFLTCIWMQIKWKLSVENYCRQTVMLWREREKERESTAKLYPLQFTSKQCKIWYLYFIFFQRQIYILHIVSIYFC